MTIYVMARWLSGEEGNYQSALHEVGQALVLYRSSGNRGGQASALSNSGYCHVTLGDPAQGRADRQQAVAIHEELGGLNGQANAWHSTGLAERHLGSLARAVECFRRALGI